MTHYLRTGKDIDRGLVGYWKLDDLKRIPSDGIIAHYKMNDNAANTDVIDSKSGNTGTANVNTSTMTVAGKINQALQFNGTSEFIDLNKNLSTYPENFTICLWAKIGAVSDANGRIFDAGFGGGSGSFGFTLADETGLANSTKFKFAVRTTDDDTSGNISFDVGDNLYHHWMLVKNGTSIELFVDNDSKGTDTLTQSEYRRSVDTNLGGIGATSNFGGDLDDVRIYNRALSSSERASVYNSGTGTETTELFRQTIVAIDRAKFNDGVISGATNTTGINGLNADAMFFDGVDDRVQNDGLDLFDPTTDPFSISLWAKTENKTGVIVNYALSTNARTAIGYDSGSGHFEAGIYDGSDKGPASGPGVVGKWTHIVYTSEGGTNFKMYIDGVLQSGTGNPAMSGATERIIFGMRHTTASVYNGSTQNARFYNRTLTAGEASKLHRLKL